MQKFQFFSASNLQTNLALYRQTISSALVFLLKTHLIGVGFLPETISSRSILEGDSVLFAAAPENLESTPPIEVRIPCGASPDSPGDSECEYVSM